MRYDYEVSPSVEAGDGWGILYRAGLHLMNRGVVKYWECMPDGRMLKGPLGVLLDLRHKCAEYTGREEGV